MLYLGYPVELSEAHRICHQPMPEEYDYGEALSDFLQKANIDIFYLDDGVCIIGRELPMFSLSADYYYPLTYVHQKLEEEKIVITNAIQALRIDLSSVQISHPGADSQTVRNPEPYLLFY